MRADRAAAAWGGSRDWRAVDGMEVIGSLVIATSGGRLVAIGVINELGVLLELCGDGPRSGERAAAIARAAKQAEFARWRQRRQKVG